MFIRVFFVLLAVIICICIYMWLKNSKFLDKFLKNASSEPDYKETIVDTVIDDIRAKKDTLKQKAVDNKAEANTMKKEASKIEGFLKK